MTSSVLPKVAATPEVVGVLLTRQLLFAQLVAKLISWVGSQGWGVTLGEAFRTPEQAEWNAQKGIGIKNSVHTERLAIDLNLFVGGVYQKGSAAYLPLGQYWESLGGSWGGRFPGKQVDGNHFSLEWQGVK